MRISLKKIAMLGCICVFLMGNAHLSFADGLTLVEAYFAQGEGYSGLVNIPGKGQMRYYAQNDPLWAALCYEKSGTQKRRPFRDSGCGPTAFAMVFAELIPQEELPQLCSYAKQMFSLCPCSLNKSRCNKNHDRYIITSERDYIRFLPLIFGDYATGNNLSSTYSRSSAPGTQSEFMEEISLSFGIEMVLSYDLQDALAALENGASVIALAAAGGSFTDSGHYVKFAHADDERLYILDPLYREEYKTKNGRKIEIVQPGLVALKYENIRYALFSKFYIFSRK